MSHAQNRDPTIGREILVALSERRHLGAQMRDLDAQYIDLVAHSGELRGEPILDERELQSGSFLFSAFFGAGVSENLKSGL